MGFYTDAVNNASGALNNLGNTITTAVVADLHLKNQKKSNAIAEQNRLEGLENSMAENAIDRTYAKQELSDLEVDADLSKKDLNKTKRAYNKANREFKKGNISEDELGIASDEYLASIEAHRSAVNALNSKTQQWNKLSLRKAFLEKQYGNDINSAKLYDEIEKTIRGGYGKE